MTLSNYMLAGLKIFRDQKIETFKQLKGPL